MTGANERSGLAYDGMGRRSISIDELVQGQDIR